MISGGISSGDMNGWAAVPSSYVIDAQNESDIAAGVRFANEFNLRLVVKGTGISVDIKSTHLLALFSFI